jgi:predicted enzyme related to lactoylglutathione lyase
VSDHFTPRAGAVFSADIAVPEHERELRFYARVLSTGAEPPWRAEDLMNNLGMPIMLCLTVADLGESIHRVEQEGGRVLPARRGDGDAYMYAAIRDPVGAHLALVNG